MKRDNGSRNLPWVLLLWIVYIYIYTLYANNGLVCMCVCDFFKEKHSSGCIGMGVKLSIYMHLLLFPQCQTSHMAPASVRNLNISGQLYRYWV